MRVPHQRPYGGRELEAVGRDAAASQAVAVEHGGRTDVALSAGHAAVKSSVDVGSFRGIRGAPYDALERCATTGTVQ